MAILNYTTKVEADKTVAEITGMLVSKGANSIRVQWDNQQPIGIEFETDTRLMGRQTFFYQPNVAGVLKAMQNDPKVPNSFCHLAQARRVAWRIEKDWLEAMWAKLDATLMPIEQIFMAYLIDRSGTPLFDLMVQQHKALPSPNDGEKP